MAEQLSDIYQITINGVTREIKMSWGMLSLLASYFTDPGQIENLKLDFHNQSILLNELLAERDEKGKKVDPNFDYAMFLDFEEGKRVSQWMEEHLADFFISRLQEQVNMTKDWQPKIEKVIKETLEKVEKDSKPTRAGLKNSASKT